MNAAFQVVWAALLGAIWGSVLFGSAGVVLAAGVDFLVSHASSSPPDTWLRVMLGLIPPVALFLIGAYVVALRQGLGRVVELFVEHELTASLYKRLRPTVRSVAAKLRDKSGAISDREAVRSVREAVQEQRASEEPATSTRERLLQSAIARAEGSLATLLLMEDGKLPPGDELVARVETVGVEQFEELIAELFERIYLAQLVTAVLIAVGVCALPVGVYWLAGAFAG